MMRTFWGYNDVDFDIHPNAGSDLYKKTINLFIVEVAGDKRLSRKLLGFQRCEATNLPLSNLK